MYTHYSKGSIESECDAVKVVLCSAKKSTDRGAKISSVVCASIIQYLYQLISTVSSVDLYSFNERSD